MKKSTVSKLREAELICEAENRSTEYMLQFMADFAGVPHECVVNYIRKYWSEENSDRAERL